MSTPREYMRVDIAYYLYLADIYGVDGYSTQNPGMSRHTRWPRVLVQHPQQPDASPVLALFLHTTSPTIFPCCLVSRDGIHTGCNENDI
jgi:hypothetical protein